MSPYAYVRELCLCEMLILNLYKVGAIGCNWVLHFRHVVWAFGKKPRYQPTGSTDFGSQLIHTDELLEILHISLPFLLEIGQWCIQVQLQVGCKIGSVSLL